MLVYVFSAVLLLAPPLQAVFDLPLQLAFQQAVLIACLAWWFLKGPPAGTARNIFAKKFLPLWFAAALSFLSLVCSPFKGFIFNEWGNYAAGLLIFVFSSFLDGKDRLLIGKAVAAGGWLVFGAVLAQLVLAPVTFTFRPPLTNLNALALYALLLLPPALGRRSWALAAALAAVLLLSRSAGAAMAVLAAAGFYYADRSGPKGASRALFFAVPAVLAAGLFCLLSPESAAGRLAWWGSAWDMFAARPLAGFGHAAFTWAQAGFQAPGAFREHAIYAHNYYLEFLAENGIFAAAAWFWFLSGAARSARGAARYSVIAALVHSFVDFGLSVPANFWVFCFFLSSSAEEAPGGVPERRPGYPRSTVIRLLAAGLLLEAALLNLNFRSLAFDRARAEALASAGAGDMAAADAGLRPWLAPRLFRAPALEFLGRLSLAGPADRDGGFSAAVYYEMALLENPYSSGAWRALEAVYKAPGREAAAAGLAARKAGVYK